MRKKRYPSVFFCMAGTLTAACSLVARPYAAEISAPAPASATQQGRAPKATPPAAAGVPAPEQQRLDALAGRWRVRQSMWNDPGKAPVIDHGTATFTAIHGGRHLRQVLHIDSPNKPFEGLGYLGYDDASGRYDSLWMDVNFAGMILAHGSYDPGTHTYTFAGTVPDPAQHGATSPLREVMHVQDARHFTYEYYERHAGREALAVRLEYTRMK